MLNERKLAADRNRGEVKLSGLINRFFDAPGEIHANDNGDLTKIDDPKSVLGALYALAEFLYGFDIAQRMLKTYGGALHPNEVETKWIEECAKRFTRLIFPVAKPAKPSGVKPVYVASGNPVVVKVEKMWFERQEKRRNNKSRALWDFMEEMPLGCPLANSELRAFLEGLLKRTTAAKEMSIHRINNTKGDENEKARKLCAEAEALEKEINEGIESLAGTEIDNLAFARGQWSDFRDYIMTGLTRATVGTWKDPCLRGIRELEFILTGGKKAKSNGGPT